MYTSHLRTLGIGPEPITGEEIAKAFKLGIPESQARDFKGKFSNTKDSVGSEVDQNLALVAD